MFLAAVLSLTLATTPAPHQLRWDPRVDLPIVGVTLAGWLSSEYVFKSNVAPPACRWCEVNGFDVAVRRAFNPSLTPSAFGLAGPDTASYVTLFATPAAMLGLDALLAWHDDALGNAPVDIALIAEATLVAICLNQTTKFLVGRGRPYTVGASEALLDSAPGKADDFISFFSGHTTFAFSVVAATATVTKLRGYRLWWLSVAIGAPLALTTGLLRLAADKHWASDVLTGMLIGTAAGIGIPLLFHGVDDAVHVQVSPLPGGLALSGTF
jgi:membrane-associated phospholipid phosphatase